MKIVVFRRLRLVSCAVLLVSAIPSLVLARVRPGIEAGLSITSLSYEHDDDPLFQTWDRGWRTSFTGGASLELPIRGRFALVTGLRYLQQGNHVNVDTGPSGVIGEFQVVQNYLSIPVLMKFRPLPSRRFTFSVGPEVAFLLSGRLIAEYSTLFLSTEYQDIKDDLDSSNFSLDAGAGFEFPMENHVGVVSLRYSHGLVGVAKEDHWVSDWKTRSVDCLVGMRW